MKTELYFIQVAYIIPGTVDHTKDTDNVQLHVKDTFLVPVVEVNANSFGYKGYLIKKKYLIFSDCPLNSETKLAYVVGTKYQMK